MIRLLGFLVASVFALLVLYGLFFYESDITVVSIERPVVDRDPRFDELLEKSSLMPDEKEELDHLSYQHHKKLNPNTDLSFEDWKKIYILRKEDGS